MGTSNKTYNRLGIDIGSTTVKVAILDSEDNLLFSDYQRHFANIQETLAELLTKAYDKRMQMLHGYIEQKNSNRKKTSYKTTSSITVLEQIETKVTATDVTIAEIAGIIKNKDLNAIETYKKYFNVEEVVV